MKISKFFKTVILSVLITCVFAAAFTLTGCGEELPMSEQINVAVNDVSDFLLGIVTANNYTYVSERYDGYLYERTVDGGNMKVNDNGTVFYFVEESGT